MSQMNSIRISHPKRIIPASITSTGELEIKNGSISRFWQESDESVLATVMIQLPPDESFNCIEMLPSPGSEDSFPDVFRFEISDDGKVWEPIIQETSFRRSKKTTARWNFSLIHTNYIKLVAKLSRRAENGRFRLSFQGLELKISGIVKMEASSELDRLWVKENLIDGRADYGWSSRIKNQPGEEYIILDLGSVHRVHEIRMLSKYDEPTHFPERFFIYYSEDDMAWHQLLEEPSFLSEPGSWYRWRFIPVNLRFVKIVNVDEPKANQKEFQTEITEIELFSSLDSGDTSKSDSPAPTPYASVLRSGLVRLAVDGENREAVVVQGSDRRLRDATTEYKGIVELASDGEEKPGVVVQGNDRRLKLATEQTFGLTRLARSGEDRANVVIQGNDERLKAATTENMGIIELAEDGETRPGVAVQGNDSRLKKATLKDYGLVILGENGDTTPGKVISGDDVRLRDATTESKGILRFARNGEESAESAVQGNDKRLKLASTESYGIVQLARSGETKEGLVVQGNDPRLKEATEETPGIVTLSRKGENTPGKVVVADDPRLSDKRDPLPHTHEYAPLEHDFSSHTGMIRLKGTSNSPYQGVVPPQPNLSVIYGKNEDPSGAGILGVGGNEGVVGFGGSSGVTGISNGFAEGNAGVVGIGSKGSGGYFTSTQNYALIAQGSGTKERNLQGSGKGIYSEGENVFLGSLRLDLSSQGECIAKVFRLDMRDVVVSGDLLVATDESGKLSRSKHPYSTNVIGVVVDASGLILGREKKEQDQVLVALAGVVLLNVDPQGGDIKPGDLLVSGLVSGHAIKADPNKLKPGMVVAKALEPSKKQKGAILALLSPA